MRVRFGIWGAGAVDELKVASFAVVRDGESRIDAVARSVARSTGLVWCGGPSLESSGPGAAIYHGTLGRPLDSGGWSPVAEVWLSVSTYYDATIRMETP
jgi:hypothetical protein